jgi:hypothetical protein
MLSTQASLLRYCKDSIFFEKLAGTIKQIGFTWHDAANDLKWLIIRTNTKWRTFLSTRPERQHQDHLGVAMISMWSMPLRE